jgi:hypothetical protein
LKTTNVGTLRWNSDIAEVFYYNGVNMYAIRFQKCIKTRTVLEVYSGIEENVTEKILAYAGPYLNFHGIPTTPKLLGYEKLTFRFLDDNVMIFNSTDIMRIQ